MVTFNIFKMNRAYERLCCSHTNIYNYTLRVHPNTNIHTRQLAYIHQHACKHTHPYIDTCTNIHVYMSASTYSAACIMRAHTHNHRHTCSCIYTRSWVLPMHSPAQYAHKHVSLHTYTSKHTHGFCCITPSARHPSLLCPLSYREGVHHCYSGRAQAPGWCFCNMLRPSLLKQDSSHLPFTYSQKLPFTVMWPQLLPYGVEGRPITRRSPLHRGGVHLGLGIPF